MSFKKVVRQLHLWLGLISGIIVFIVCITGCIWVFQDEILNILKPYENVKKENASYILPSSAMKVVEDSIPGKSISSVSYNNENTIVIGMYSDTFSLATTLNAYNGKILHVKDYKSGFDFFSFVLNGHRHLWMPWEIGRPIVNYATLSFVIILISGLILWWPKNKKAAEQRFWFRWKDSTQWKRKNYDLHNIMGFYAMLFLLAIALTGMTWGLEWFSNSLYWSVSGGKTEPKWQEHFSDTLQSTTSKVSPYDATDKIYQRLSSRYSEAASLYIYFPEVEKASSSYAAYIYPPVWGFKYKAHYYDQYSLKEIPAKMPDYENGNIGDKLSRMYYGIHVGEILGFPGKVLAFLASLIGASLPVTGVMIWWGRRKKEKAPTSKKDRMKSDSSPAKVIMKFEYKK